MDRDAYTADVESDIPEEFMGNFIKAMKIGYYREFYKRRIITADELDILLKMQDAISEQSQNNETDIA